jgi:cytochrome c peroxidase
MATNLKSYAYASIGGMMLMAWTAQAHGPLPMSLKNVPIPPVPGLLDGPDPIVVDKQKAIVLGKALFFDVNLGSDGMSCASCHFHAGADRRVKNQLNPGDKGTGSSGQVFDPLASGAVGGPNYSLRKADFPLHQYNDPLDKASGLKFSTDDVVASVGTFGGRFMGASRFRGASDTCEHGADPSFHVAGTRTRRVEPRNAPTVINAAFNHRNFWDGRANNIFNGSSVWGERDPNAGVWERINAREVVKRRLHLQNSSLASLATAPPLDDREMGCRQRGWPEIGRKLLSRPPLQRQRVHPEDSVLGALSWSTADHLRPGLRTTYRTLVTQAFNRKYWSYSGIGPFGAPPQGTPYNQMEANFVMFAALALQLFQDTLISDEAPIDLTTRDRSGAPTWRGLGYDAGKIARLRNGFDTFISQHCNLCHAGPAMTTAAIALNAMLVTPTPGKTFGPPDAQRAYGKDALGSGRFGAYPVGINHHISLVGRDATAGGNKLLDFGFANTGVTDPAHDPGLGGVDDFGNPLSFAQQYVQYLVGNTPAVKDPGVGTSRSCDFVIPLALNYADPALIDELSFWAPDGLEIDGSREGVLRNQDCLFGHEPTRSGGVDQYIPTVAAARTALSSQPAKLALADRAVFKIPSLRNVELTGPFMHNGGMATLEQVLEFYSRLGNVDNPDKHSLVDSMGLRPTPSDTQAEVEAKTKARQDLIEFLKSFTDERVRYERAPFDHPEIPIPNGHRGDHAGAEPGNPLHPILADDDMLVIPAVGRNGVAEPLKPFDSFLND